MRIWCALALALGLAACGGGGSGPPAEPVRLRLGADRQWSAVGSDGRPLAVQQTATALVVRLPAGMTPREVRLGQVLVERDFGLGSEPVADADGTAVRVVLYCEGRVVDPAEGGIPAPAEVLVR